MKDTKVQWHPGFVAAVSLELTNSRNVLIFEKEYNLNTKPLEIDLLVIRKNMDIPIENEIGHIFRGHNIMEYKSPEDHLNIDTFYKAIAYASLYKSYGKTVDSIKASDITLSLVREQKPAGLFQHFALCHYTVSNPYSGIYYIENMVLFPTQIIVTGELKPDSHIWLRSLSGKLKKQDLKELLKNIGNLTAKSERELADSILEVSVQANAHLIQAMQGDETMTQTLLQIIEPQLLLREKEWKQEGLKEGLKKGIQGTVDVLRSLKYEDGEIKPIIRKEYGLTDEEADEYLSEI